MQIMTDLDIKKLNFPTIIKLEFLSNLYSCFFNTLEFIYQLVLFLQIAYIQF